VHELARAMVKLAHEYPEYAQAARKVKIVKTSADRSYGTGYQDVQNRVPKIENTVSELEWSPKVSMRDALVKIFDSYKDKLGDAEQLNS
jgi:hypothetical protein